MSTDVFILHSQYTPAGDQPEAIARLIAGVEEGGSHHQPQGHHGLGQDLHDGDTSSIV